MQPVQLTQPWAGMVLQLKDWASLLLEEVLHHPMGLEALDFLFLQLWRPILRQEGLVWLF